MSLELRNCLEASLGVRLSPTLIFTHPNVASLADYLHDALGVPSKRGSVAPSGRDSAVSSELSRHVESLSKRDLLAFFDESLKGLGSV